MLWQIAIVCLASRRRSGEYDGGELIHHSVPELNGSDPRSRVHRLFLHQWKLKGLLRVRAERALKWELW